MKMKKVLFVAYEFPPEGCRGTKRAMKFIKYMLPMSWEPVVLTVENPNYEFHDGSLLAELPSNLKINRAVTLESLFVRTACEGGEVHDSGAAKRDLSGMPYYRRLLLGIYHGLGRFFRVPDSRILWLPFAVVKGLRLIRRENIDVIFASGPSFTNHLVGVALKKLTGKPLVIDFRDAWVSDPARRVKDSWQRRTIVRMEKMAVTVADKVVSTTEGITLDFIERYGAQNGKFITITNGYDLDDFKELKVDERENGSRFRIVHAGTLGWERNPRQFLKAVGNLLKENKEMRENVELVFVGQNTPFRDGRTIEDYISENGLEKNVRFTGFVSRKQSLEEIAGAHLLLLIIGKVPPEESFIYGISAKMYDYALANRPVLTIAEQGASADMAARLRLGAVITPDDNESIKESIRSYYMEFKEQGQIDLKINSDLLNRFNFTQLTDTLVRNFNQITVSTPKFD